MLLFFPELNSLGKCLQAYVNIFQELVLEHGIEVNLVCNYLKSNIFAIGIECSLLVLWVNK